MLHTMRWFGPHDSVSLFDLRQAGCTGVVAALHQLPVGSVWPVAEIQARQQLIAADNITHSPLRWAVVESIPVHEAVVVSSGPLFQAMKMTGNKAALTFTDVGSGLVAKGGGPLDGFTVAGSDHQFVPAQARIEGNKVVVWNDQVPSPAVVRYAWADNPECANLYNREGLPASTFTTELAQ